MAEAPPLPQVELLGGDLALHLASSACARESGAAAALWAGCPPLEDFADAVLVGFSCDEACEVKAQPWSCPPRSSPAVAFAVAGGCLQDGCGSVHA